MQPPMHARRHTAVSTIRRILSHRGISLTCLVHCSKHRGWMPEKMPVSPQVRLVCPCATSPWLHVKLRTAPSSNPSPLMAAGLRVARSGTPGSLHTALMPSTAGEAPRLMRARTSALEGLSWTSPAGGAWMLNFTSEPGASARSGALRRREATDASFASTLIRAAADPLSPASPARSSSIFPVSDSPVTRATAPIHPKCAKFRVFMARTMVVRCWGKYST
mmetsp:Transcript_85695/g.242989  ORF Transcript_85695/g.242989 Transcript_85695/m.242989 type:complete len:220 (-) Transcript_85695:631-1290(-)